MAKQKTAFFCQNCGASASKWIGRCPSCDEWNTYVEEIVQSKGTGSSYVKKRGVSKESKKPQPIHEIAPADTPRIKLIDEEFNRVLGGGIVPGSIVLIGGEPGIGKSTLLLQLALSMQDFKVLYVSGEESAQQIGMRAERIGSQNPNVFVLNETATGNIFHEIAAMNPGIVVIDSIQTLNTDTIESAPGSVSQIKACAGELLQFAKTSNVPVFLIGHITKDGNLAGPKVLEHMVDTVLQFEGDSNNIYRLLRATKNRFGSVNELGIYEMMGTGLKEVTDPSQVLISGREDQLSGVTVAATMEGLRPMLIEVQALVGTAAYGTPQRSTTGFDGRRLNMLLAVLEKRCSFRLGAKDVFLNIAGGLKVDDPAIDLAIVSAVLSSNEDMPISHEVCFAAEVGLSGEIRAVSRIDQRISEAEKLGFRQIFISGYSLKGYTPSPTQKIEVIPVKKIEEVFSRLFG